MSSISKKLTNIDGYIFESVYGPWDYESTVSVYIESDLTTPINSGEYKLFPREGRVIFSTPQYNDLIINIQDQNKTRIGIRISNDDISDNIKIYGLGTMHSNISSIKNYLQNVPVIPTPETTIVCTSFPWISCIQPSQSVATVYINSVSGNECYDIANGTYIYDSILDTAGLTGWWFAKTDRDIALIIVYCKTNEKFYAQIYDRTQDIAIYGATINESVCSTFDNDRFKDITYSGTCCDGVTSLILGSFTLDGLNSCSLFQATVQISKAGSTGTVTEVAVLESSPASGNTITLNSISPSTSVAYIADSDGNWAWPLNNTSYDHGRLQTIYLQSDIGFAGTITSVSLNIYIPPSVSINNWIIRMKHTALTSYSSNNWESTGWTTVYTLKEYDPLFSMGWNEFILDIPFEYDGVNNLMIDFTYKNAENTGNAGLVWYTSNINNRSLYAGSNVAGSDPLTWAATTPAGSLISRSADIKFGFESSKSSTITITFTNSGGTSISVDEPVFADGTYFALDPGFTVDAVTLEAGQSVVYGVYFVGSDTVGTYTDTLTFYNDSPEGDVVYSLSETVSL